MVLKKLSGGNRYLLVSDERHVAWALEKRFEILDVIRKSKRRATEALQCPLVSDAVPIH